MSEIKLDNRHFSVLEYIYDNPYISYDSLISAFSSYNDMEDIVLLLDQYQMISLRIADSFENDSTKDETYCLEKVSHLVTITAGNTIIEQERRRSDELNRKVRPLYDIAEKTSSLAESALTQSSIAKKQAESSESQATSAIKQVHIMEEQLRLVKEQAESAKKESLESKRISLIAILVSMSAVVVAILQLFH